MYNMIMFCYFTYVIIINIIITKNRLTINMIIKIIIIGSDRSAIRLRRDASAVTGVRHPKVAACIPPFPLCTSIQASYSARSPIQMWE